MKIRIYQINGKRAPFAMYMGYSRMSGSIDPAERLLPASTSATV